MLLQRRERLVTLIGGKPTRPLIKFASAEELLALAPSTPKVGCSEKQKFATGNRKQEALVTPGLSVGCVCISGATLSGEEGAPPVATESQASAIAAIRSDEESNAYIQMLRKKSTDNRVANQAEVDMKSFENSQVA